MTIEKLMVPFQKEETSIVSFKMAAMLAHRFKAHLDIIHIRPLITAAQLGGGSYPFVVTYIQPTIDSLHKKANEHAKELNTIYETQREKHDISAKHESEHSIDNGATASWCDLHPNTPHDYVKRGRVSDIVVLAKSSNKSPHDDIPFIEEMVFQSGRPILIVSDAKEEYTFPETIMIAWDGGREATHAVAAALPILQQARHVLVVCSNKIPHDNEPVESIVSYLKLHGVHAFGHTIKMEKGQDPEKIFLKYAEKKDAGLIVMGAYSHSRLRELVLGGFTRHLLHESKIPLLMAH